MAVITFNPFTGGFDVSPALTFPGTLVIASGKTATINNTLTFSGTDSTTMTFPTTSATLARTDAGQTFTGAQVITEPVGASGLTITGATQTSPFPALAVTQTWNNSGTTFTGSLLNITRTAASTSSRLMDVQVAGVTKFYINDALRFNFGTTSANDNLSVTAAGALTMSTNALGTRYVLNSASGTYETGLGLPSDGFVTWVSTQNLDTGTKDLKLARDTANTLAQRNGTAAQTFNLGNTITTVATAGEWWKLDWQGTANQFRMGAVAGSSSGTNRAASWDFGNKLASATAAITVPATSGNIVFGGGVQLSNAAATGLAAGVLAATTNATIVLYDSTGQAYRVPCII